MSVCGICSDAEQADGELHDEGRSLHPPGLPHSDPVHSVQSLSMSHFIVSLILSVGRKTHRHRSDTEMPFADSVAGAALVAAVSVVVRVEPRCLIVQRFPASRTVSNAPALAQDALLSPSSLPPPNKAVENYKHSATIFRLAFTACLHSALHFLTF